MQKHEEVEFKETLIGLGEYYGKEITESLTKIYWYDLKPLSIDQFKQAASAHRMNADNGQFFPKTADLMRQINGTTKQLEQAIEDKAEIAWHVIEGEIRRVGSWGTLKMEDRQALAAVQAIGGWKKLCGLSMDKMTWAHKEFIAAYQNYERADLAALPNKLPGRIHLENHKKNQHVPSEFMAGLENYRNRKGIEQK
jgi:hypothetical protein